jgi:predicted DCC family thiol-disulfide oxidoreductase YuxK
MAPLITVYHNTKCPVCSAGIDWQRNRLVQAARTGIIEFRDINLEPDALSHFGAGLEDVRRRLHAVDADGHLYVGGTGAKDIGERGFLSALGAVCSNLVWQCWQPWQP